MAEPRLLMSEEQMDASLKRVASEICEHGLEGVTLIGIRTRGVPIAQWLARKIEQVGGKKVPLGEIDINLYRDDLSEVGAKPVIKPTQLPFDINGKGVILVDDVLYTGRTIRAAMDALIDHGRPKFIRLMVMVDRGWREFPIQADYVARRLETSANENVKVMLKEIDQLNQVVVKTQNA